MKIELAEKLINEVLRLQYTLSDVMPYTLTDLMGNPHRSLSFSLDGDYFETRRISNDNMFILKFNDINTSEEGVYLNEQEEAELLNKLLSIPQIKEYSSSIDVTYRDSFIDADFICYFKLKEDLYNKIHFSSIHNTFNVEMVNKEILKSRLSDFEKEKQK